MNLLDLIYEFIKNPSLWGYPILIFIIIYFLLNPEKVEKWGAILFKAFAYFSVRAEKKHISLDIQSYVNSFQKQINDESEGLLPYGIKIEWVSEEITPESFLAEGKVIIRLGHHKNRDENIIRVILEYISQALVPEIKHHITKEVRQAIDFTVVKKILSDVPSALNRFYETRYKPEVEENPKIEELCKMMEDLDSVGWFTRIFLREMKEIGVELKSRFPNLSEMDVNNEIIDFLRFLHTIATKRPEEIVPLSFIGNFIKVAIVLVARPESIDLEPHKRRIKEHISKVNSIYLAARGGYVELVKFLAKEIDNWSSLRRIGELKVYSVRLNNRKVKSICVRYKVIESDGDNVDKRS
jgi:small subunit ribosomal protein S1